MPPTCTVCRHPDRASIDRALVSGLPFRHIAAQWSVSTAALQRHKASDLPVLLTKAVEAAEAADADDLLAQLRDLQATTLGLLEKAEAAGKLGTAVMAVREARLNLELLAKLRGELDERPTLNLLIAPEWLSVRGALLAALHPYPQARAAVAETLIQLGAG